VFETFQFPALPPDGGEHNLQMTRQGAGVSADARRRGARCT
jgi:hypothetical protein